MSELIRVLKTVTKTFDRLQVDYAVMGGLAVRVLGLPRPTYDVDFVIACSRDRLEAVFGEFDTLGFAVPEPFRRGWLDEAGGMPLVKFSMFISGNAIAVDMFLAETPFLQSAMARRMHVEIDGVLVSLVTAEDLILLKVIANRLRDRADIADIRFTQGDLDEAYLRFWVDQLEIQDRFADVWRETEP